MFFVKSTAQATSSEFAVAIIALLYRKLLRMALLAATRLFQLSSAIWSQPITINETLDAEDVASTR